MLQTFQDNLYGYLTPTMNNFCQLLHYRRLQRKMEDMHVSKLL